MDLAFTCLFLIWYNNITSILCQYGAVEEIQVNLDIINSTTENNLSLKSYIFCFIVQIKTGQDILFATYTLFKSFMHYIQLLTFVIQLKE